MNKSKKITNEGSEELQILILKIRVAISTGHEELLPELNKEYQQLKNK